MAPKPLFGGSGKSSGGGGPKPLFSAGATTKKSSTGTPPAQQLTKLASKVANFTQDPYKVRNVNGREVTPDVLKLQSQVSTALGGMTRGHIERLATRSGLDPQSTKTLVSLAGKAPGVSAATIATSPLSILNVPSQTALGGISEGPSGALRGFLGQENYTPVQAFARRALGETQHQAKVTEREMNPALRFGANFAGAVVTDPTTYLSFGTTALAKAGARSAADEIALRTGQTLAKDVGQSSLSRAGTDILGRVAQQAPKKALTKEEYAAFKSLPRKARKAVDQASGGAHFLGKTVPGTRGVAHNLGPEGNASIMANFQNRAELQAGERAGRYQAGTAQTVENVQAADRGAKFLADLRGNEGARIAKTVYGRKWKQLWTPEEYGPVRDALLNRPVSLNPKQQEAFDRFVKMGDRSYNRARESTRLVSDEAALQIKRGKVLAQQRPKIVQALKRTTTARLEAQVARHNVEDLTRQGADAHAIGVAEGKAQSLEAAAERLNTLTQRRVAKARDEVASQQVIPQRSYFPEVPTQAQRDLEARSGAMGGGMPGRKPGFAYTRSDTRPIEQKLIESGPHQGEAAYELDPVIALGQHARSVELDAARIKAYGDLGRLRTEASPAMPNGAPMVVTHPNEIKALKGDANFVSVKAPVVQRLPNGESKAFEQEVLVHKSIADDFARMSSFNAGKDDANVVLNGMKYTNALWARYATATTGFISRNVLQGNLYMGMVLAGAKDPLDWAHSLGVMKRLGRGIKEASDPYAFLRPNEVQLVKNAIETNSVESNFMNLVESLYESSTAKGVSGGLRGVRHKLATSKASPVSPNFFPLEKIAAANQWMEAWSRLSVFMNKSHTLAPADAGAVVRKYMIDYTDLPKAARAGKYVNPFLTWAYKTVPLVTGTVLKDPKKVTIPMHLINAVGAEGETPDVVPEWMKESGAIGVPKVIREHIPGLNKGPLSFIPADPVHSVAQNLQPISSLAQALMGRPGGWQKTMQDLINTAGVGGSGGAVQGAVEGATGTELFSGRKFKPGTMVPLVKGVKVPWEVANVLNSLLPALSRVNAVIPPTDYDAKARARRVASILAGFTLQPINPSTQKSEFYRRIEQLTAALTNQDLTSSSLTKK